MDAKRGESFLMQVLSGFSENPACCAILVFAP